MRRNLALAVAALALGAAAWGAYDTTRRVGMYQGYQPEQPIAFSHALHAGEKQIACLYCHFGAEKSRHAGIPPLSVCMNCHRVLTKQTIELAKLQDAVDHDRPVRWIKVHNVPDFVYFNHSQHVVAGGLDCAECHGAVEEMEVVRQEKPLTMGWCLECHRSKGITEFSPEVEVAAGELPPPIGGMDCSKCHY